MALRWLEAGQACQNTTIFSRLYPTQSGTVGSTYTDEFGRTVFDSASLLLRTPALVGSPNNTWVIGFGFQLTQDSTLDSSPSASPYMSLRIAGGEQLRIEAIDASDSGKPGGNYYKLRVMRGATLLATTNERFNGLTGALNLYRTYFQFKAVVRTSTNGSFELKYRTRRGTTQTATWTAANTGINTANQGSDGADRAEFSWTTGGSDTLSLTDIYVLDSTGSVNNDYLGVLYMEAMKPDGTGTTMNWTLAGGASDIEDALDEAAGTQSGTEDDKRLTSSTVGQIALATMSNLSGKFGTTPIVGVQVRMYGKMDSTGTRDVQFFYRKTTGSPAQTNGGTLTMNSTAFVGQADTTELDPNTSAAWVLADIQAEQLGCKLNA
jgi:hypothetical protein